MHISDIQFARYDVTEETGTHRAALILHTDDGTIGLDATAEMPSDTAHSEIAAALLADAMRQLSRMPGYRTGERRVTLAEDVVTELPS